MEFNSGFKGLMELFCSIFN